MILEIVLIVLILLMIVGPRYPDAGRLIDILLFVLIVVLIISLLQSHIVVGKVFSAILPLIQSV